MHLGMSLWAMLFLQPYDVPYNSKESCYVVSAAAADRYIFVRVHEVSTGKTVLQSTLRGGQSRGVVVASKKIKIEHKRGGEKDYHSAVVVDCDNGNTIRI